MTARVALSPLARGAPVPFREWVKRFEPEVWTTSSMTSGTSLQLVRRTSCVLEVPMLTEGENSSNDGVMVRHGVLLLAMMGRV